MRPETGWEWWRGREGIGNLEVNWSEVKWKSLSSVQLFATPGTVACRGPLSMGFSRQEYWSGLPFPSPLDTFMEALLPGWWDIGSEGVHRVYNNAQVSGFASTCRQPFRSCLSVGFFEYEVINAQARALEMAELQTRHVLYHQSPLITLLSSVYGTRREN